MLDRSVRSFRLPRLPRRSLLRAGGVALAAPLIAAESMAAGITAQEGATATPAGAGREAAEVPFPAETQLALEAIVDGAMAATMTPGALVGVWYPGQGTWTKAAGIGDLATGAPVTLGDHVRIASNTKTFVGVVVLQLVDEGEIGLDDPLERYVPGIPNGDEITIRQVLGMTAGVYNFVRDPRIAEGYAADPLLPFTPEDALAIIRDSSPDYAPGTSVQYSDSNYILLGFVVEAVTGRPLGQEIDERLVAPLGLTETTFPNTPEMPQPAMHGYAAAGLGDPLVDATASNPDVPWGSGAMVSTLADLKVWVEALATGALVTPETFAQQLAFTPFPTVPGLEVGYGLGLLTYNGLLGHNGGIVGYSSWMMHDPATGATLVIVTNRSGIEGGTADPIFGGITQLLFPDRFPPLAIPATPVATPPGA